MARKTINVPLNAENNSGQRPVEYKVLIKTNQVERTSDGGIYYPETVREKEKRERVHAMLVAVGGLAFKDPDWGDPTPKVGEVVQVHKYAGERWEDFGDGCAYKIINDKDILAIVDSTELEIELADSDQPDHAGDGVYSHLRSA